MGSSSLPSGSLCLGVGWQAQTEHCGPSLAGLQPELSPLLLLRVSGSLAHCAQCWNIPSLCMANVGSSVTFYFIGIFPNCPSPSCSHLNERVLPWGVSAPLLSPVQGSLYETMISWVSQAHCERVSPMRVVLPGSPPHPSVRRVTTFTNYFIYLANIYRVPLQAGDFSHQRG